MPILQSGDLHVYGDFAACSALSLIIHTFCTVADLVNNQFYFALAAATGTSGPKNAYDRPYMRLDLTVSLSMLAGSCSRSLSSQSLWAEAKP